MINHPDKGNRKEKEFIDLAIADHSDSRQGNQGNGFLRELVPFGLQSKLKPSGNYSMLSFLNSPGSSDTVKANIPT